MEDAFWRAGQLEILKTAQGPPIRPNTSISERGGGQGGTGTIGRRIGMEQRTRRDMQPSENAIFTAGDAEDANAVDDSDELHAE